MKKKQTKAHRKSPSRPVRRKSDADFDAELCEKTKQSDHRRQLDLTELVESCWGIGDWQRLRQISLEKIRDHPQCARLALMIASAHLQGSLPGAEKALIEHALQSGCGKRALATALIAGAHNSLGRAIAMGGDVEQAGIHFERSIASGLLKVDCSVLNEARTLRQMIDLGLEPGGEGQLQLLMAWERIAATTPPVAGPEHQESASSAALDFYKGIASPKKGGKPPPFVLFDSKSLPRSGLHYLHNTLARLLGDHYSFCSWYQEVGCCKQRPCALTGYAQHARESGKCRIRLIKSHDFNLTDPILETNRHLHRLILVRDPLFTLTSWFELDQLGVHQGALKEQGIDIRRIWQSHEKEILATAYQLLDGCFEEISTDQLLKWLVEKSEYIIGFMDKWANQASSESSPNVHLISYEEIDMFILETTNRYRPYLSEASCRSVDEFSIGRRFRKRDNPFSAKSENISGFLQRKSSIFEYAANRIRLADKSGLFRSKVKF